MIKADEYFLIKEEQLHCRINECNSREGER